MQKHLAAALCLLLLAVPCLKAAPINRFALVSRHNVVLTNFDAANPLSVGNGEFCFTVDATGLQTFPEAFEKTTPLGTLSDWGWHTFPNPNGWDIDHFQFKEYPDLTGRLVPYADVPHNQQTPEIRWLRSNPHRLDLGQIGFVLKHADGSPAMPNDLTDIQQTLDLWTGGISSRFKFDGEPVKVETFCDPKLDAIAVRVDSPLVQSGRLAIQIHFPYGTGETTTADWSHPEAHETILTQDQPNRAHFERRLDNDHYVADAEWSPRAIITNTAPHQFEIRIGAPGTAPARLKQMESANPSAVLEFVCAFSSESFAKRAPASGSTGSQSAASSQLLSPLPGGEGQGEGNNPKLEVVGVTSHGSPFRLPTFAQAKKASDESWSHFWQTGGAIDLSGSKDPRWFELERRIVLSQYLTAIQNAGSNPPQETGLTYNSWEGKFHLEMHWWHEAHFALWNRLPLLEKSLGYYERILPRAEGTARKQGYAGARWPKMTSPSGAESPSPVGPFLIWQEPHPIFYAELCWREHHDRATLEKYRDVVFQTAEFMASYPTSYSVLGTNTQRYVLGPVLQCAQEIFPKDKTLNPTFELTYWRWGLETAQQWRQRLGLSRDTKWDDVLDHLAKPSVADGKYLFTETTPNCYTNPKWNADHPAVLGALSFVPGPQIDPATMRNTFDWIWKNWNWPETWGWDYPLMAMTAARLGETDHAIDALLLDTPKNHYGLNGHVYQRPNLTIYLPANGGLLYAVALMASGWDGAPARHAPGFPDNGQWSVRWENLSVAP